MIEAFFTKMLFINLWESVNEPINSNLRVEVKNLKSKNKKHVDSINCQYPILESKTTEHHGLGRLSDTAFHTLKTHPERYVQQKKAQ